MQEGTPNYDFALGKSLDNGCKKTKEDNSTPSFTYSSYIQGQIQRKSLSIMVKIYGILICGTNKGLKTKLIILPIDGSDAFTQIF